MPPALRADLSIIETYEFLRWRASDLRHLGLRRPGRPSRRPFEKLAPWRELTGGSFMSRQFAGHRFFLHDQRDELINAIRLEFGGCLTRAPVGDSKVPAGAIPGSVVQLRRVVRSLRRFQLTAQALVRRYSGFCQVLAVSLSGAVRLERHQGHEVRRERQ